MICFEISESYFGTLGVESPPTVGPYWLQVLPRRRPEDNELAGRQSPGTVDAEKEVPS